MQQAPRLWILVSSYYLVVVRLSFFSIHTATASSDNRHNRIQIGASRSYTLYSNAYASLKATAFLLDSDILFFTRSIKHDGIP